MANLRDRVKCATATTGTGTITLGAAAAGYRTFASAYAADRVVSYVIEDGAAWETGVGTYSVAANTLTRAVDASSTGAALALTGSATVGVAFLSRDSSADWPLAIITGRNGDDSVFQNVGSAFTTIALNTPDYDPFAGWSTSDSSWVVPQAGAYDIDGKVRFADNTPSGVSFGIGLDVTNQDSPGFAWLNTLSQRQGGFNSRTMFLNVGDRLRLFTYYGTGPTAGVISGYLRVARVR